MIHIRILFKAEYIGWQEFKLWYYVGEEGLKVLDSDDTIIFIPHSSYIMYKEIKDD